jgi:hypothetical protein
VVVLVVLLLLLVWRESWWLEQHFDVHAIRISEGC